MRRQPGPEYLGTLRSIRAFGEDYEAVLGHWAPVGCACGKRLVQHPTGSGEDEHPLSLVHTGLTAHAFLNHSFANHIPEDLRRWDQS